MGFNSGFKGLKMSVYTHQLILDYHHYYYHHISQYGNVYLQIHDILNRGMDLFKIKKF